MDNNKSLFIINHFNSIELLISRQNSVKSYENCVEYIINHITLKDYMVKKNNAYLYTLDQFIISNIESRADFIYSKLESFSWLPLFIRNQIALHYIFRLSILSKDFFSSKATFKRIMNNRIR